MSRLTRYHLVTYGTYDKRYHELLFKNPTTKPFCCLHDGKFVVGEASTHLTEEAILLRTLRRLRYGRQSNNSIKIY